MPRKHRAAFAGGQPRTSRLVAAPVRGTTMRAIAFSVLAGLSVATVQAQGSGDLLQRARQAIEAKEPRTAEIHLKNLLRNNDNAEARYLLGNVYIESGDLLSAEKELRRAFELGYDRDRSLPALMQVLLNLRQPQKVLDLSHDLQLKSREAQADALATSARALLQMGKEAEAKKTFADALAANPDHVGAKVSTIALLMASDRAEARKRLAEVLKKAPDSLEARGLMADIDVADGNLDAARQALADLAARLPRSGDVRARLVSLELEAGQPVAARKHLDELAALEPGHPRTEALRATLALREGHIEEARTAAAQALRLVPDLLPALSVAGVVNLQSGQLEQAERMARQIIDKAPEAPQGYRLLGAAMLRMNQPDRALEAMRRAIDRGVKDATIYSVAGEAALKTHNPEASARYFEQAASLDPADARKLTGLAVARLAAGDRDAAIDQLEQAIKLDSDGIQADLVLVQTYARAGKFDQALQALDRMDSKAPRSPVPSVARGTVLQAKGDLDGARKAFERALQLDPKSFPATASLAALDLRQQQPAAARKRYETLLAADPSSSSAYIALAQLDAGAGKPRNEVMELLRKARDVAPKSVTPVLATARYLMDNNAPAEALTQLQQGLTRFPDDLSLMDGLAAAQMRLGQRDQAIATWERMVRLNPRAWPALMRIGEAQRQAGQNDLALATFRRASDLEPDAVEPRIATIATMHTLGRKEEARRMADAMRASKQHAMAGTLLRGDLAGMDQDWPRAIEFYGQALATEKTPLIGSKLLRALNAAGRTADGQKLLADWIQAEPENLALRSLSGDNAVAQQRWRDALEQYQVIVAKEPANALALNNAAWAAHELKDANALDLARRAWEAAPKSPAILDTYGVILSEKGDPKGLELLREAVAAAPQAPQLRLHLAEALLRAGDKKAARAEVEAVLKATPEGPMAEAAKALQARL